MSKRRTILAAFTLAAAADVAALAAPSLDLAALLREAESNNPEIAAMRLRQEAASLVPGIAEVPPDPVVSVSYLNDTVTDFTLGRSEFSSLAFSWTQEVPFPGKLHLGGAVASREAEMARSRLDAARLDVAAGIKGAYADLYRIDRSASILGDRRSLLVSFMQRARARYETGEGLLENVLKAQSEITRL